MVVVVVVVMVDIIVHAAAVATHAEKQIGTPDVFIHVARYISTHSPLK